MSDLQKRAHELAPFIADALREVAAEATVPDTDDREWTSAQKASRDFAVDLAETLLTDSDRLLGAMLIDDLTAHAEAARDEEVNDG